MPIYDFRCTKCNSEFTVPGDSDDEIRETFCVECQAGYADLEVMAYSRDDDDLVGRIFEKLADLEKEQRRMDREITKLCSGGMGQRTPKIVC